MERQKGIGLYLLLFLAGFLLASVMGPHLFPPARWLEAATAPPLPPQSPQSPQENQEPLAPQIIGGPEVPAARIEDIGQRVALAERQVALAEQRLAELERRFVRHTHEFTSIRPDRVAFYDNFIRDPDAYRNALIPYWVGPSNRTATTSVTGPPRP